MLFFWNNNIFWNKKILKILSIIWQALLGRLTQYLCSSIPLVNMYVTDVTYAP